MTTAAPRAYSNFDDSSENARRPHTSLVVACYRVEQYLPEFLASLDEQAVDHGGYELIFVIDGCPERSEDVVRSWSVVTDFAVRIIVQENGGVASARNTGLDHARGTWVSSPDPDDRLSRHYLASIEAARAAHPDARMFVGRIRLLDPAGASVRHPLDGKYRSDGVRLVDLEDDPEDIHTLGGVVFFDRRRITELGLRMHEGLPTASDADFIMRYLLATGAQYVLVPGAEYFYQRRADDSSIVKTQERNIERFRIVFGVTHRALLEAAGPDCPRWLANTLLYFTSYLFRRNLQRDSPVYDTDRTVLREIAAALRANLGRIGAAHIERFSLVAIPTEIRMAWLAAALEGERPLGDHRMRTPVQLLFASRSTLRVALYAPSGDSTSTYDVHGGELIDCKVRGVEFLGEHWVDQHVLLVRSHRPDEVRVSAFSDAGLVFAGEPVGEEEIRQRLDLVPAGGRVTRQHQPSPVSPVRDAGRRLQRLLRRASYSVPLRVSRLLGSGVRLDGVCVVDLRGPCDEARVREIAHRIRASATAPTWSVGEPVRHPLRRLHGLVRHRVGRGSREHFVLMKHADTYVSDRLEVVTRVPFPDDLLEANWRSVYVAETIEDRDYRVLNPARIDHVVVASVGAQRLLIAHGGDYRFARSEVSALTAPGSSPGES